MINAYNQKIRDLSQIKDPRLFVLTSEQVALFDAMRSRNERQLRDPENKLDGYGSRLPGLLIRIAQIFTLLENPQAQQINDQCLKQALGLADFLIDQRIGADAKVERTHLQRTLDKIASMMRKYQDDVGAVGAVKPEFTFSTRDLQQQIKGQTWVVDGGVKAVESALSRLENQLWIYADEDDRWMPRADLLDFRW